MCKRREAFSLAVLIGRGLVQVFLGLLLLLALFSFQGANLLYKSHLTGWDFFVTGDFTS